MKQLKKGFFVLLFLGLRLTLFAYDNSPASYVIVPECIWAKATGGGTWSTQIQVFDRSGGSQIFCFFDYGGGNYRGPFIIWTSPGVNCLYQTANILQTLDYWDGDVFDYFGRVGAVAFFTQDANHLIQVQARTNHSSGFGKTFNGLTDVESNTAAVGRPMLIQGVEQSSSYRFFLGCYNPSGTSVTVEFNIFGPNNNLLGSFIKTFVAFDFQAFNPFAQAGLTGSYTNCFILINPTAGAGRIMVFGASANNLTNDPASHVAVHYN